MKEDVKKVARLHIVSASLITSYIHSGKSVFLSPPSPPTLTSSSYWTRLQNVTGLQLNVQVDSKRPSKKRQHLFFDA